MPDLTDLLGLMGLIVVLITCAIWPEPIAETHNYDPLADRRNIRQHGYRCGLQGMPHDANPYLTASHRSDWLEGWLHGNACLSTPTDSKDVHDGNDRTEAIP